jgi:hypothetical protein
VPVSYPNDLDPTPPRIERRAPALPTALAAALALVLSLGGCGDPADERPGASDPQPAAAPSADGGTGGPATDGGLDDPVAATERPERVTDSIAIEGMAETMELRLFRTPDGFPLPFSTYVPEDMDPSADAAEGTTHFTAEFGGARNEDAFLHMYIFPEGTAAQEAVAVMKGYKTSRGVPVSKGLEPIADDLPRPDLRWATEDAYRFLYESGNTWFTGTVGVGERDGRFYMIVRHFPQEYGDGFAPRAALILDRWQWADGSRLNQGQDR